MSALLDDGDDFPSLNVGEEEGSHQWLISYADVITLLLCFFVLFFNIRPEETVQPDGSSARDIDLVVESIQSTFGNGRSTSAATNVSAATTSLAAKATDASAVAGDGTGVGASTLAQRRAIIDDAGSELKKLANVTLKSKLDRIAIDFATGDFFESGSFELTPLGSQSVQSVATTLMPFLDRVRVEIQGHTDDAVVSPRPGRHFKTNMELSALRALSVYREMAALGYPASMLSISGFGDQRAHGTTVTKEHDLGADRRVSFSVEAL